MFAWFAMMGIKAQDVNIKTNLLADIALSPNLGVEVGLKPHWSIDLTGQMNLWTINDHKWKHWFVAPEARYWFCEYFAKHFMGLHLIGGQYNFGNIKNHINFLGTNLTPLTDHRFQGTGLGAGISYGYDFLLTRHLNIEFEIGIGYIYTWFDEYECANCGKKIGSGHHNYVGPTKAAIDIVYVF